MIALTSKATPFRVASFFILAAAIISRVALATPPTKNRETSAEIIQKAQNLILQKDRRQALEILNEALKSERPNGHGFKELKKTITELSHIFIGEKNQQLYELSLSLKRTEPAQALTKIIDALHFEPENLTLLLETARQNLTKGDCKAALETTLKAQTLNPWDDELTLVLAQVKICQNDLPGFVTIKEGANNSNSLPWWALEIEKAIKEKNLQRAKEALSQMKKLDKNYPERHYWAWKIDLEQKTNNFESAQAYKNECQNLTVPFYRRFILDPRLCSRIADVEAFLKTQPQRP